MLGIFSKFSLVTTPSSLLLSPPCSPHLFVFFTKPNEAISYDKDVCSICYKYIFEARTNKCDTVDSNQGKIFAVVISSIAQINALNRTVDQSDGFYLSTIINASADNPTIASVIDDLKRYDNYTTQILSDTANPLILNATYVSINSWFFEINKAYNIVDSIILEYTSFSANGTNLTRSQVKGLIDTKKLTFDSFVLQNAWNGFLSAEAQLNYNYGNPTIQFLKSSGVKTITFRILYFDDTENILKNPNGPRFYGSKNFTLQINFAL